MLSWIEPFANSWTSAICTPITVFLWTVGLLVYFGLPNYYRQTPGKVPSFYKSVFRRKIVLWNWVVVILQNFFLSAPYGRNWNCKFGTHSVFPVFINYRSLTSLLFQSSGSPPTPNHGKSSSSVSPSSASSGSPCSSSWAGSPNPTAGSYPSSPAVSEHHAGPRFGGEPLGQAYSCPGQGATPPEPWSLGVCGSGWAC